MKRNILQNEVYNLSVKYFDVKNPCRCAASNITAGTEANVSWFISDVKPCKITVFILGLSRFMSNLGALENRKNTPLQYFHT